VYTPTQMTITKTSKTSTQNRAKGKLLTKK